MYDEDDEDDDQEFCAECDAPVYPPETFLNDDGVCNLCAEGDAMERIERLAADWTNGNIASVVDAFSRMHPLDAASTAIALVAHLDPPAEGIESIARILGSHAPETFTPATPAKE